MPAKFVNKQKLSVLSFSNRIIMPKVKQTAKINNRCVIPKCKHEEGVKMHYYTFPTRYYLLPKRERWIKAINRAVKGRFGLKGEDGAPWQPGKNHRICVNHFVGGKKSENPCSRSYIPTIFPNYNLKEPRRGKVRGPVKKKKKPNISTNLKQNKIQSSTRSRNNQKKYISDPVQKTCPPRISKRAKIQQTAEPPNKLAEYIFEAQSYFSDDEWEFMGDENQLKFGRLVYIYFACNHLGIQVELPYFMIKQEQIKDENMTYPCQYCNADFAGYERRDLHLKYCEKRYEEYNTYHASYEYLQETANDQSLSKETANASRILKKTHNKPIHFKITDTTQGTTENVPNILKKIVSEHNVFNKTKNKQTILMKIEKKPNILKRTYNKPNILEKTNSEFIEKESYSEHLVA